MDWQARYEVQQTLSESFKGATFQALDRQNGQTVLLRVLYRSTGELYETLKGQSSRYLPKIYGVFPDGEDTKGRPFSSAWSGSRPSLPGRPPACSWPSAWGSGRSTLWGSSTGISSPPTSSCGRRAG